MKTRVNTITLAGHGLTDDEQLVLATIYALNEHGVTPAFRSPQDAVLKMNALELVDRGLLYRVTGELPYGADQDLAGFALKGKDADWIAATLFDSRGWAPADYARS